MNLPFLVCAIITAVSAFTSLGFSLASISGSSKQVRTSALYTTARSLALACVSVIPLLTKSLEWLKAVAVCMIVLQLCDAAIGITIKDKIKTLGPAVTAAANLAALLWLTAR